jgi:dTDP-glucose 4,6-dehydratase
MQKKKILITGSGGFIMSNFIRQAFHTKQPYNINSLDRVRDSRVVQNIYVNKGHKFFIADIRDPHIVNVIFQAERPDIVLHAAAESFVDSSIDDACPFVTSNVLGTQIIIDACKQWGVERLIYLSTDEVYGHLTCEIEASWTEDIPLAPRNPYSASKAAGEHLVRAAYDTHGLQFNITRSCNNYGPWQTPEKFIPKTIKYILENKSVPVYGKGEQIRDWIHVFDNCSALFKIISDGKPNETYNISAGQEYSNLELFQIVCNSLGTGHDLIQFVDDRPGHDFRYSVDSSKLKKLGWLPEYKFKAGIKEVTQWYCMNKWFLENRSRER